MIDSTIPPTNDLESALVRTLPANNAQYTAIVRGVNMSVASVAADSATSSTRGRNRRALVCTAPNHSCFAA